jgi:hypothetical protein
MWNKGFGREAQRDALRFNESEVIALFEAMLTIRFPETKRLLWERKHAIDEDLSRLPTPIEKGTARLRISNLCDDFIKDACDHINAHDTGREFYLRIGDSWRI